MGASDNKASDALPAIPSPSTAAEERDLVVRYLKFEADCDVSRVQHGGKPISLELVAWRIEQGRHIVWRDSLPREEKPRAL